MINKLFYSGRNNTFGFGSWNSGVQYKPNLKKMINKTMENNSPNNISEYSYIPKKSDSYFTPEIIRLQMLESRLNRLSAKANQSLNNSYNNPLNNSISKQNNYGLNQTLNKEGINGYDQWKYFSFLERERRRRQVKEEIREARDKIEDSSFLSDMDDNESAENEETNCDRLKKGLEGLPVKQKGITTRKSSVLSSVKNSIAPSVKSSVSQIKKSSVISTANKNIPIQSSPLVPIQSEAEDFVFNKLDNHVAFKLQAKNFRTREDAKLMKTQVKDLQNEIENKLEEMETKQKINAEKIRSAIQNGGTLKLKQSVKNTYDKEKVDLNKIMEEQPKFIKEIPNNIQEQLNKYEEERMNTIKANQIEEQKMRGKDNFFLPLLEEIDRQRTKILRLSRNPFDNRRIKTEIKDEAEENEREENEEEEEEKKRRKRNKSKLNKKRKINKKREPTEEDSELNSEITSRISKEISSYTPSQTEPNQSRRKGSKQEDKNKKKTNKLNDKYVSPKIQNSNIISTKFTTPEGIQSKANKKGNMKENNKEKSSKVKNDKNIKSKKDEEKNQKNKTMKNKKKKSDSEEVESQEIEL